MSPARDASSTPVALHGRLSATARGLVGNDGTPVVLRGVSLFWSQWKPQFFNARAVRWLRDDWCADLVRAPLAARPGGYLENPLAEEAKVDAVVNAAVELGMYVVIDWHCHEREEAAALRFFVDMAKRYGSLPNVIYETWNEPLPRYDWACDIKPYHRRIVSAIREHDTRNLVVLGTPQWSRRVDIASRDPVELPNVAYAIHFYAASHREEIRRVVLDARRAGACLFASEWGASESNGDGALDTEEARRWLEFLEAQSISHANWSISDKAETCAALCPGANPFGSWRDSDLTRSGKLVRDHLRNYRLAQLNSMRA
jgi:endoglucanase